MFMGELFMAKVTIDYSKCKGDDCAECADVCPMEVLVLKGDKIEIVVDKSSNGTIKNNAELRWLAYVNTDFAKKNLIKWFEKLQ